MAHRQETAVATRQGLDRGMEVWAVRGGRRGGGSRKRRRRRRGTKSAEKKLGFDRSSRGAAERTKSGGLNWTPKRVAAVL